MPRGSINDLIILGQQGKSMLAELDASGNYLYIGYSIPGHATSDSAWQIQKLTYDSTYTTTPITIKYAGGTDDYDKVWTNRASYNYS